MMTTLSQTPMALLSPLEASATLQATTRRYTIYRLTQQKQGRKICLKSTKTSKVLILDLLFLGKFIINPIKFYILIVILEFWSHITQSTKKMQDWQKILLDCNQSNILLTRIIFSCILLSAFLFLSTCIRSPATIWDRSNIILIL